MAKRTLAMQRLERRNLLATYYVDSVGGNDSDSGDSETQAWASLGRIAAVNLAPGDNIRLRRGSNWAESFLVNDSGTVADPITFDAYGEGQNPTLFRLTIDGGYTTFDSITVDHNKQSGDAIRIRNAVNVTLRDMVVRNGINDGVDATGADGLMIDGLLIHHFLAGSFTVQADAHGVIVSDTLGLTIRNTEIHSVSGDSFQADPDRDLVPTNDILIEKSHFWTGPLTEDFNASWLAGQRPGENAIDTKVVKILTRQQRGSQQEGE